MPVATILRWLVLAACIAAAPLAQAQVARVIEIRGAAMVERTGMLPRLLGTGENLDQRDTIRVAADSWTVLEFRDQMRITLRPDSVFRIEAYTDGAPESVLVGLIKGGMRAVTGLIGKRNPRAFVLGTPMATIGIRGTEFDARLCNNDCDAEEKRPAPVWPVVGVAARVTGIEGEVSARDLFGRSRTLLEGGFIDAEEEISTGAGAAAVLELRDGGRIALDAQTRFEIRRFVYDPARPAAAIAEFALLAGTMRAATGAIGKSRPVGYRIVTKLGRIETRGTVVGLRCAGVCETPRDGSTASNAGDPSGDMSVDTFEGTAVLETSGGSADVRAGQSARAGGDGRITSFPTPPEVSRGAAGFAPANPGVPTATPRDDTAPGLYSWVRDGAIVLSKAGKVVDVPAGRAALATPSDVTLLAIVPNFLRLDTTPLPDPESLRRISFFTAPGSARPGFCRVE